jgi:hypothetical protein
MSPRGFVTLAIVTGLALIVAIALVVSEQIQASGDRRAGGLMFPELAARADEITQVSIVARRYSVDLELVDGQWVAADRADYPVKSDPVEQLLAGMEALVEYERKTNTPELYPLLGVAGPSPDREDAEVTVTASNGDVLVDAIIGYPASAIGRNTRGGVYVRRANEDRAWLAEGTVLPPTFITEFFDQLFNIPGPSVGRVTILEGETILIDAVKTDFATGDFDLVYLDPSIGPEGATARDSSLRGMSQAIVSTTFLDAIPVEDVHIADDARTVRYVTQDGLSLSVTLADADDGRTFVVYDVSAAPGSPAEEQAATIRAATSAWAFELQGGRLITLRRAVTDLFDPPPIPAAPAQTPAPAIPLAPVAPAP